MGEPTHRRPESALRSWQFTPGSDARKLAKAVTGDADALILDLEDAVAESKKAEARPMVAAEIRQHGGSRAIYVRVNAVPTGLIADDLAAIAMPELAGIWLPKAETIDEVRHTDDLLTKIESERGMPARSVNLLLSFETARGVQDAYALASAAKRVTAVSAGTAEGGDLHAEMGGLWSDDIGTVPFVRSRVALAGRAAGLRCIIDGACTRLDDATVARSAEAARQAGYSGKMTIHPRHNAFVHAAFAPTDEEVGHANEVIKAFAAAEAAGTAAITVGGRMIDYAMVVNARRVLTEANAGSPGDGTP